MEHMPWRRAFREEAARPSGVVAPVECWAFCLLAASLASLMGVDWLDMIGPLCLR